MEEELIARSALRGKEYLHGFKAKASRQAEAIRSTLGLRTNDRLDTTALFELLDLRRWGLSEVAEVDESLWVATAQLYVVDQSSFSGALVNRGGRRVVLINDSHGVERQRATETHEAAHAILQHSNTPFLSGTKVRIREAEAGLLGRCLLISEAFTVATARRNFAASANERREVIREAASHMNVSTELMQWAFNDAGAWKRAERSHSRR